MKRTPFLTVKILGVTAAICGTLGGLSGCTSVTPNLDGQFGQSVSLIKAQQTLNPSASRNTNPVNGLDGVAAKSGYDAYQKSYAAPLPPANAFTIGIGSGR